MPMQQVPYPKTLPGMRDLGFRIWYMNEEETWSVREKEQAGHPHQLSP